MSDKSSLPLSVALGALLVPVAAVASVLIIRPPEAGVAAQQAPTTTAVPIVATTAPTLSDDITTACGSSGRELVDLERADSTTRVQQAALDALRPVCEALGLGLPEPTSEPGATAAPPAPSRETRVVAPSTASEQDPDEYEYEYEDGRWEVDD